MNFISNGVYRTLVIIMKIAIFSRAVTDIQKFHH